MSCRLTPGGPLYPPPGIVDVPFAVAPELGDAKFVSPRDFIWEDNLPFDLDGHGTHVSGTHRPADQQQRRRRRHGLQRAHHAGEGDRRSVGLSSSTRRFIGTDDIVARGIRYAADNGANVINMSIGREGGGPATAVEEAIRYAVSRGVFVAVSAR